MSMLCKLMDLTGPPGFPTTIALGIVQTPPGGQSFRVEFTQATLTLNDELQRTLFEFDDEEFIPFDSQLELGINAVGGAQDLGATVISDTGASQAEMTTRFHPAGINGPFYELTYKLLPD